MQDRVLAYLKEHPDCTMQEMADALGTVTSNINYHLSRLAAKGVITYVEGTRSKWIPNP